MKAKPEGQDDRFDRVRDRSQMFTYIAHKKYKVQSVPIHIQGDRTQTVTSNLDLTGRKYAINFNLNVDSDQGRLEI